MENPTKSLIYLEEMEELGEEILRDRQDIIAMDKKRNQKREALRELKRSTEKKVYFALGSVLVKMPNKTAEQLLLRDEVNIDVDINKIRSNLKVKVNDLRDMEFKPPVPGLMLKALTSEEMNAVGQVLKRRSF